MQNFCIAYRGILNRNELYATETTGRLVEEVTNLSVHKFLSGRLGGGQQLCSMIEMNQIDMIIFLRDPDNCSHEDEREASNMFRVCDMHNPVVLLSGRRICGIKLIKGQKAALLINK